MICHRGNLHDVGIHSRQFSVEGRKIGGRFMEIVVADNPFCATVTRHLGCDVVLQIDVVGPLDDCGTQEQQP